MNITKKNILKSLTKKTNFTSGEARIILESLLVLIKTKSKLGSVKLNGFGSFSYKKTPKRIGRNPKTKDSYIIPISNKLSFRPSNKIKESIN